MKSCYLTALIAMSAMGQNVPMFRGNLQHTGVYDGAGVRRLPHVEWRFKTQGKVISSPAVANGTMRIGDVSAYHCSNTCRAPARIARTRSGEDPMDSSA